MKNVTGSVKKVGTNAIRALKQSPNVFIYVGQNHQIENCLSKIRGALIDIRQQAKKDGKEFIEPIAESKLLIYTEGKLYQKKWGDVL